MHNCNAADIERELKWRFQVKLPMAFALCFLPGIAAAQAVIVDLGNPPDEATLQQMERDGTPYQKQQAQAYRRQARRDAMMAARGLPTLQQRKQASMAAQADGKMQPSRYPAFTSILTHMQGALQELPMRLTQAVTAAPPPVPLTRQPLQAEGCTPGGQHTLGGGAARSGLNGSRSLYRCEGFYLMAYEWDYSRPLRGQVTIDASGYEKHPGSDRYKVREMTFPSGSGSVETMLSWISPDYQIRLDVYTPTGRPRFSAQLDRLTSLLEKLAEHQENTNHAGQ